MFQRIWRAWQRLRARKRRVVLEVVQLEERCTPTVAFGPVPEAAMVPPSPAPIVITIRIEAPTAQPAEPAKPVVRTDLFCSGLEEAAEVVAASEDEDIWAVAVEPEPVYEAPTWF